MIVVFQGADDGIVVGSLNFWTHIAPILGVVIAACVFAFSLYKNAVSESRAQRAALEKFNQDLDRRVEREVTVQVSRSLTTNISILNEIEERSIRRHADFADWIKDAENRLEARSSQVDHQSANLAAPSDAPAQQTAFEDEQIRNETNEIAFEAQIEKILPPPIEPDPWIDGLIERYLRGRNLESDELRQVLDLSERHRQLTERQEEIRTSLREYLEANALSGPSYYYHDDGTKFLIPSLAHRRQKMTN